MDLWFWIKVGLSVAALAAALWSWDEYVREPYVEEGRLTQVVEHSLAMEKAFGKGVKTPEDAAAILKRQSDALKLAEAEGVAARSRLNAVRAQSEKDKALLSSELQKLWAEKPAFTEDPCRSACALLRQRHF